jgi:hypothetical protein
LNPQNLTQLAAPTLPLNSSFLLLAKVVISGNATVSCIIANSSSIVFDGSTITGTSSQTYSTLSLMAVVSQGALAEGYSLKCLNQNIAGGEVVYASSGIVIATTIAAQ